MNNAPFADNAASYWSAGLPVFPTRGKKPAIYSWQELNSRMPTPAEQAKWLADFAELNFGLALGAQSGVVILDIDNIDAEHVPIIEAAFPSPWRKFGKKGCSLAFKFNGEKTFQIKGAAGVLIELLSTKRQTVMPPSIHPDTMQPYTSNCDLLGVLHRLPTLPANIEDKLRSILTDLGYWLGGAGGGYAGDLAEPVINPATGLIEHGRNDFAWQRVRWGTFKDLTKSLGCPPSRDEFILESYRRFAEKAQTSGRYSWTSWRDESSKHYDRLIKKFPVGFVKAADLSGVKYEDALKLLEGSPDKLSVALGIVYRFNRRVPTTMTADEFILEIECSHGWGFKIDDPRTMFLEERLSWVLKQRQDPLRKLTKITNEVRERHNVKAEAVITPADRAGGGVIILKWPHATGKTKNVGRPAAQECAGRFLAVCHRISLTKQLSQVLEVAHYQDKSPKGLGLATCVNSIGVDKLAPWTGRVDTLFIDELSQVLRHLFSKAVSDKTRPHVFGQLVDIVRRARLVICADADMNDLAVEFLEYCRPGEKFTISEIRKNHHDLQVTWDFGKNAVVAAMGLVLNSLGLGKKVIVMTDSVPKARLMAELAKREQPEKRVLLIVADNKGDIEQQAFLEDPELMCLSYDLVVHSPAISSGVSIEVEHFEIGVGLFYGTSLPSDALQMMRRARRLKNWHITFDHHPLRRSGTAESITAGWVAAAGGSKATEFDQFRARVEEAENIGTSDFAFGLLTLLGDLGYSVKKLPLSDEIDDHKEIRDELTEQEITDTLTAVDLTEIQARKLEAETVRTYVDEMALRKFFIRRDLRVADVVREDVVFYDKGRGLRKLKRFELATGYRSVQDQDRLDLYTVNLSQRQYVEGKIKSYQLLLGVLDLLNDETITEAKAEALVSIAMKQPEMLSGLKVVPSSIVDGRPKSAVRFLGDMFRSLGLELRSERPRAGTGGVRGRAYFIKAGSLIRSIKYAENRSKWSTSPGNYILHRGEVDHFRPTSASAIVEAERAAMATATTAPIPNYNPDSFSIGPLAADNENHVIIYGNSVIGDFT